MKRFSASPAWPALLRDIKYAVRGLGRQPSFACTAIAVLVLGVGASTAVFSVLRGVLITPLPYRSPEQLVLIRAQLPGNPATPLLTSAEFAALRGQTGIFESVAAAVRSGGDLTVGEHMTPVTAAAVSENFFETLGVAPVLGRAVRRGDGGKAINISHDVWQRHFAGDAGVLSRPIEINEVRMAVVGVLPRDFKVYLGSDVVLPAQLDVTYHRSTGYDDDPFRGNVVIARIRRGVTVAAARAAVDAVAVNLAAERPEGYRTGPVRLSLEPVEAEVVSGAKPSLVAAAGAVTLVMIVACANLTNLLLARASSRAREIGVRVAIGASPRDILRQLATEGLVLGAIGAAGGWVAAQWGVAALLTLAPAALPRREAISIDGTVTVFAIALALVCGVIASLVPAWQLTRRSVSPALTREPARAVRTRGLLVAIQLAMSVMLLVGAALMARTFVGLRSVPLGFDARHTAALLVALSDERFNIGTIDDARALRRGFYERLIDAVRDVGGVRAVGTGFPTPLSGTTLSQRVSLGPGQAEREVDGFVALGGYFEALDVPLVSGRYFTRADNTRPVVIVDERLGRELWPGQPAVGQRLLIVKSVGPPQWTEVVGVVAHVQARGIRDQGPPQVWMTYGVRSPAQLDLVVRAANPSDALASSAALVRSLGAGRPVRETRRLSDAVTEATADTRFALFVIGILAALAVVLAAVGVYGVVAYAMARRQREVAVRLALGASRQRLVALVLGEGAVWIGTGVAVGLAGAATLSRFLESLLFQVERHDVRTFGLVAGVLSVVALTAALVPALRASRVDPMLALRGE